MLMMQRDGKQSMRKTNEKEKTLKKRRKKENKERSRQGKGRRGKKKEREERKGEEEEKVINQAAIDLSNNMGCKSAEFKNYKCIYSFEKKRKQCKYIKTMKNMNRT